MLLRLVAWFTRGSRARSSASGRDFSAAAWANEAWRPADDCLEWCLIGATGDAEARPLLTSQAAPARPDVVHGPVWKMSGLGDDAESVTVRAR